MFESKRPGVNRKGQFRLFVGTEILFRVFQTREAILPDLIQQVLLRLVFSPFGTFHSGGVVQGNGAGRAGLQFGKPIEFDPDPQWAVQAELEECKNEKEEE